VLRCRLVRRLPLVARPQQPAHRRGGPL